MKRVHKEGSVEEFIILKYFHSLFPQNVPLAIYEQNHSLITLEFAENDNLYELMKNGKLKDDDLRSSIEMMAMMQQAAKEHFSFNIQGPGYFSERIKSLFADTFLDESVKDQFMQAYVTVGTRLDNSPVEYYKDCNLKNIFHGPIFIDFENPRLAPPQLDLVNLLEFSQGYLDQGQIESLAGFYLKKRKIGIDKKEFLETYRFAALQRHLELMAYRFRDFNEDHLKEDSQAVWFHLQRAAYYARSVENSEIANILENLSIESLDKNEKINYSRVQKPTMRMPIVAGLAIMIGALSAFGATEAEKREIPEVNRVLFEGKNKAAIIKITSTNTKRGISKSLELYLADEKNAVRLGDVNSECISWNFDRSKVLFAEKMRYAIFDFKNGKRMEVPIPEEYGICPVFLDGDSLLWPKGNAVWHIDLSDFSEVQYGSPELYEKMAEQFKIKEYSNSGLVEKCESDACISKPGFLLRKHRIIDFISEQDKLFISYISSEPGYPVMNVSSFDLATGLEIRLTDNTIRINGEYFDGPGIAYVIR